VEEEGKGLSSTADLSSSAPRAGFQPSLVCHTCFSTVLRNGVSMAGFVS
jgi:hypothetical protein